MTTGHTRSLDYSSYKMRKLDLGGAIIRLITYWGLYWGPPILGNYQLEMPVGAKSNLRGSILESAYLGTLPVENECRSKF